MIEFSGRYQQYDCYETYLLCEEFDKIAGDHVGFHIPEGVIVTCDMMRCFLKAAYLSRGISRIYESWFAKCRSDVLFFCFYKLGI